jgi:hypothetical protein
VWEDIQLLVLCTLLVIMLYGHLGGGVYGLNDDRDRRNCGMS